MKYSSSYQIRTPVHGEIYEKVLKASALRTNSLSDCLSYLAEAYASAKKEYPFLCFCEMDWVIYDFERSSCYAGSFKIDANLSFLELATEINLSQFRKF